MNKKIMPRVLSVLMAIVLFVMAPLFLTGCGSSAELNSVAKAAAKDYYKNHVDYENFANTSYVFEQNSVNRNTFELEYLASAEATEKTKGQFTNVMENNIIYNFYVVNVGDKIAVVININAVSTEKTYDVDENDLLKETNEVNSKHTLYKLSFVENGDVVTYYLTKEYEVKEGEKVVETAKTYRVYDNEDEYINAVENILSHLNRKMVKDGYFDSIVGEMSLLYRNMITIEGSGSTIKAKMNYDTFNISSTSVIDIAVGYEIGFENNKLGKIVLTQKSGDGEKFSAEGTAKFNVVFSAENVNTEISIAGATENEYLYILNDDLPAINSVFAS